MVTNRDGHKIRAFAIDMDGTLAGADHRVTPRTVPALREAEKAGIRTIIVTGRAYPTALEVWQSPGLSAPLITCGGTHHPARATAAWPSAGAFAALLG